MAVNTKTATGRRDVHYATLDDLLADVETLAAGEVETHGNWTFGQILDHLAVGMTKTVEGFDFKAPLPLRIMMQLFMKRKLLTRPLPPGFKTPKKFPPPRDIPVDEAVANLRSVIARMKSTDTRALHPFLGSLSKDESDQFQLRHAELHMSFVSPVE